MNPRAIVGLLLVVAGALVWFTTPHGVTWGNHHEFKQLLAYGLLGAGALFLLVGSRR